MDVICTPAEKILMGMNYLPTPAATVPRYLGMYDITADLGMHHRYQFTFTTEVWEAGTGILANIHRLSFLVPPGLWPNAACPAYIKCLLCQSLMLY